MKGEIITAVAAIVGIAASVVGVAVMIGNMQGDLAAQDEAIVVLRDDVRELRDGWVRHLESHLSPQEAE